MALTQTASNAAGPAAPARKRPDHASQFATLSGARRVWAVGAVHGEAERLRALHDVLEARFAPGDRLVYLGNFLGHGRRVAETVDEMLRMRTALLALPGVFAADIAYLRGAQEEMWRKLLQLQFAPDPADVLTWMLAQGLEATLGAYGHRPAEAHDACREGALTLARWTTRVRDSVHARPGHDDLMAALRRAAFSAGGELLFVAAGLDPTRPLREQGDTFWWGSGYFAGIAHPYQEYRRIVRGFDRNRRGADREAYAVTVDGGCGFGGPLVAACFALDGATADWIEV